MSDQIVHVSEQSFNTDVLESSVPVLLDFWAPWCGPCRQIAPMLEELATEYAGRVKIAKVNIDDNQQLAIRYGVRSIPTLSLFVNGEIVATKVGSQPKSVLTGLLDEHL